ncbi:MAG: 50S ribosomal protein L9 [Magnetospirillum sp. WYHS-4]
MEVILLERIERLGKMGDVVKVKPGFARNFLLPRKKALRATDENRKRFEAERAQLEATNIKRRDEAQSISGKVDGMMVSLIRQAGEAGQLYGSVSARDVASAATAAGVTIARHQVELGHPIKTLGLFGVKVALHPEVTVTIKVNVARSPDEAKIQAETGKALVAESERREVHVEEFFEEEAPEEVVETAEEAASAE